MAFNTPSTGAPPAPVGVPPRKIGQPLSPALTDSKAIIDRNEKQLVARRRKVRRSIALVLNLAFVLVLGFVAIFLVRWAVVPSGSMSPTVVAGDHMVIERVSMWGDTPPNRGDVVVFQDPGGWMQEHQKTDRNWAAIFVDSLTGVNTEALMVKRVIGVPGDTVSCCTPGQAVIVNGTPLDEPYLGSMNEGFEQVTLGPDEYWLMGDNRAHSLDSRTFGPVSSSLFFGKPVLALHIFWGTW